MIPYLSRIALAGRALQFNIGWEGRPWIAHKQGRIGATTPYWTTFELPAIDVKAASVGLLDQLVAGLR